MLTIDIAPVVAALNRLTLGHEAWLAVVGEHEKAQIEQRIRSSKTDPTGHPWAPWQPSTEWKRHHKGNAAQGLLWDEGQLLGSVRHELHFDEVQIGTDVAHGPHLQEGTRHMVAREYVGWSDADMAWLGDSLIAHLSAL